MKHSSNPFLALLLPAIAASLVVFRWALQGSGNVYTDLSKQRYVPDVDLGWRLMDGGPVWLGLDTVALLLGFAGALATALWFLRRREKRASATWTSGRRAVWVAAASTLLVPLAAFATGFGPGNARDQLPDGLASAPVDGVRGSLDAPAGTYTVVTHEGSAVIAKLRAGGETFEARFPSVAGELRIDPSDLKQPMSARITASSRAVDTGIDLRSKHARDDLRVNLYPDVEFRLGQLLAAEPREGSIAFSAKGEIELVGRVHSVSVNGTIEAADGDAQKRLGTSGPTLLLRANLAVDIAETAIGNDGTFDQNSIPISVSLVLENQIKEAKQ